MWPTSPALARARTLLYAAVLTAGGLLALAPALAQDVTSVSENDFLSDMPIVLSVSRLPQRLDETPGAVTILDRDMIRRSGARDVADLMRLVPGFRVSNSFESAAPQVSYHGTYDRFSNRLELLIDGRSAYSPYLIGSIAPGLQVVALDDIERIEVLRGSNSAAYGARAFLGVINIVTRHTADTLGGQGSVTVGENSIRDAQARYGWGGEQGTYRLSVDRRSDDGLMGANGRNAVERVNLRADMNPAPGHELQLRLGTLHIDANKGLPDNPRDPWRPFSFSSNHAQLDYKLSLSSDSDLAFKLSQIQDRYNDEFPYSLAQFGIADNFWVRTSGEARSTSLSAQYTRRINDQLRTVWGGEYRTERIVSAPLFNTAAPLDNHFSRLFGNAEWRLTPDWLLNVGALAEHGRVTGNTVSPRVMLNWRVAPGHTLRSGVSRAFRPPGSYEKFADVRYFYLGKPLSVRGPLSTGSAQSETIKGKEIGYLGDFPSLGAQLDVRLFDETLDGLIYQTKGSPADYANEPAFTLRGIEYQAKWRPWEGAEFIVNQTYINSTRPVNDSNIMAAATPKVATSLTYFQKLPGQIDLTLTHVNDQPAVLVADKPEAIKRTDLRLSKTWRSGPRRNELALVVHNLGGAYPDYKKHFLFERQAFITLRLEN